MLAMSRTIQLSLSIDSRRRTAIPKDYTAARLCRGVTIWTTYLERKRIRTYERTSVLHSTQFITDFRMLLGKSAAGLLLFGATTMAQAAGVSSSTRARQLDIWTTLASSAARADALLLLARSTADPAEAAPHQVVYTLDEDDVIYNAGRVVGKCVVVSDERSQSQAVALVGSVEWLVLRCSGPSAWTMIPVENLIALCRPTGTKLAVFVEHAKDVPGVAFALQLGVDALVLEHASSELWGAAEAAKRTRAATATSSATEPEIAPESIEEAAVLGVCSAGMGDRVCLDFTCLLCEGEGVWVGSCARSLALVHAETAANAFVPSRPFRVNSGSVHSYVLMASGAMKYLCEVRAGDAIRVTNIHTNTHRDACVGRVKIEPRPLLKVSFRSGSGEGQVFLQQAETVKLVGRKDACKMSIAVTDVKEGDSIYVRCQARGTHVGNAIDADVIEH